MKRLMLAIITAGLLAAPPMGAAADDFERPIYEGRLRRRSEEQSRKVLADQLRFERAALRAQQRLALEARNERSGRSTLRPYTSTAHWALGLDAGVR